MWSFFLNKKIEKLIQCVSLQLASFITNVAMVTFHRPAMAVFHSFSCRAHLSFKNASWSS